MQERGKVKNPVMTSAFQVCSQIVDSGFQDILGLDILPNIAKGEACPGDMTTAIPFVHSYGNFGA